MNGLATAAATVAAFLFQHSDLIEDIETWFEKGLSKDLLRKSIRDAMVAASDAEMKRELGG